MSLDVLFLIDALSHGGTEKQLATLLRNLDRDRIRPHLGTLRESEALYDEVDVPKFVLGFESFARPSIVPQVARLAGYARRHRVRVIQTYFQDPFLLAAMARPFCGARLVGGFRDLGFWRTGASARKMRITYPAFSRFIANSEAVKASVVGADGLDPERIEVIYNGVEFADMGPRIPSGPPRVGIVANLNRPVKRVQDFVAAAGIVHAERPDVRFVVVGDGELREALEEQARECGVVDALEFAGRLADPVPVIRSLDVGVLTSETEGFSNAIVEYMACGVPVVATDSGGSPELVSEGENGHLVPVADPAAVARAVLSILADPVRAGAMGERNREKVRERLSVSAMVEAHAACYERVARS